MINLIDRPIPNGPRLAPTKAFVEQTRVIRPPLVHVRSGFSLRLNCSRDVGSTQRQDFRYGDGVKAS